MPSAIAVFAHPDDIEFFGAGTLKLLGNAGWDTHYFCLCSGSGGSTKTGAEETARIRRFEGQRAAEILGAQYHPAIADDLLLFYHEENLRKVAAVLREVVPTVVLTHAPQDYMEDHMITSRLASTAAFALRVPNLESTPPEPAPMNDVTVYHALPHGLRDCLRQPVKASSYADTTSVHMIKRDALAAHASQKDWLDETQGMGSYLQACDEMSLTVGKRSRRFEHAEGWRRHLHLGYSANDNDPLCNALGERYWIDPDHPAN